MHIVDLIHDVEYYAFQDVFYNNSLTCILPQSKLSMLVCSLVFVYLLSYILL